MNRYLIAEAVYLKVLREDAVAQKEAEEKARKDEWMKGPVGSGKPGAPPGSM